MSIAEQLEEEARARVVAHVAGPMSLKPPMICWIDGELWWRVEADHAGMLRHARKSFVVGHMRPWARDNAVEHYAHYGIGSMIFRSHDDAMLCYLAVAP